MIRPRCIARAQQRVRRLGGAVRYGAVQGYSWSPNCCGNDRPDEAKEWQISASNRNGIDRKARYVSGALAKTSGAGRSNGKEQ